MPPCRMSHAYRRAGDACRSPSPVRCRGKRGGWSSQGPEELDGAGHALDQGVDLGGGGVDGEAGSGGAMDPEPSMQRPGTVMAHTDLDAEGVEHLAHIEIGRAHV